MLKAFYSLKIEGDLLILDARLLVVVWEEGHLLSGPYCYSKTRKRDGTFAGRCCPAKAVGDCPGILLCGESTRLLGCIS